MTWVDQSSLFGFGTILTSTGIQNLRDNLTALANGDSGGPKIKLPALEVPYGRHLLRTIDLSSVTSAYIVFPDVITSSFDEYEIHVNNVQVESGAIAGAIRFELSTNNGSSWETRSYNNTRLKIDTLASVVNETGVAYGRVGEFGRPYNVDSRGAGNSVLTLFDPLGDTAKVVNYESSFKFNNTYIYKESGGCIWDINTPCNAIRLFSSVNVSSLYFRGGKAMIYGVATNSY